MERLVVGILAHVDAGKTTLSEGLLYTCGSLRRLGRVDHGDAFLDTETLERERGITIFSKQAVLPRKGVEICLLDTPGHVDFSSEMERTLQVLDYAILVISGTDGIQGHTRTLWQLLERYQIPVFLFVNKLDLCGTDRAALLAALKGLDEGCVDFTADQEESVLWENVAMCDEDTLDRFLETGRIAPEEIRVLIARRKLFPCYFGSALKLEGVDEFLQGLVQYTIPPVYPAEFGAKVYKIARDPQGNRLTYLKVTGGVLRVKDLLSGGSGEDAWEEKVDQIRLYSGAKFQTADTLKAGGVCAVTGLSRTRPGEGLGREAASSAPLLESVFTYQVQLPPGCDPHTALQQLRQLEEEDPQLHLTWNPQLKELHIQLMGEVQLEILQRLILDRFGLDVTFGAGGIVYRETIAAPVEGVGHYEPLRHYAEVHLLLEPGERGSGLRFATACSEDQLDRNWQRLILTHLAERVHRGVLTGSPITDMKITLAAGRAHEKHTEGGDFRQATYRAVRHGLKCAQSILLEPWYNFRLELPASCVGRAMSDLQRKNGWVDPPEGDGTVSVLTGAAPVAGLRDYALEVAAYTKGLGRFSCTLRGYEPCGSPEAVIAAMGYDSDRDLDQPADSVFCAHGGGFVVKWDQVKDYMHLDSILRPAPPEPEAEPPPGPVRRPAGDFLAQDRELQAIFERTYGPVKQRAFLPQRPVREPKAEEKPIVIQPPPSGPEYLLVDGYNIIYAWDELKEAAKTSLDAARQLLMDLLSNYQGYQKCVVILVFDAYRVPRSTGEVDRYHNLYVVYTKEAETADAYIEKATYELGRKHRVRVATSDGAEQLIILGHGALRLSARAFHDEVERVTGQISAILDRNNHRVHKSYAVQHALERAKKKPSKLKKGDSP
ncbi:MAG: GTP-binding protein [Oscillospiraceae bacterium]|nr:GTP-binding protein [Oscillospiraceae bacterium]